MKDIQIPPQDLYAEKCVLGCMVLSGTAVAEVREILSASDFHADTNAKIFKAILSIRDSGSDVDAVSLADKLNQTGDYDDVGGFSFLTEIMEAVSNPAYAKTHAKIVAKMARRRQAISVAKKLEAAAYDLTADEEEFTSRATASVESLSVDNSVSSKLTLMSDAVANLIEGFERGVKPAIRIMIPEVDEIMNGVMPGEMIVVGARPSHGKTMFALQCVEMATAHGHPALIVSEEMAAMALAVRQMQRITVVHSDDWLMNTDRLKFDAKEHFAGKAPMLIAEKCSRVSIAEKMIASAVRSHGVKVVAVDYAQLLQGEGGNEQERISDVSFRMKAMATKYDLIMILLAQLNRGIESRDNPEPQLADFRGSGSLEQDADIALFPVWPIKFDPNYKDPLEYRIYQRKNRNRGIPTTCLKMRINPARQRLDGFVDPEDDVDRMSMDWQ